MLTHRLDQRDQVDVAQEVQPPGVEVIRHGPEGFRTKSNPRVQSPGLRGIKVGHAGTVGRGPGLVDPAHPVDRDFFDQQLFGDLGWFGGRGLGGSFVWRCHGDEYKSPAPAVISARLVES